MVLYLFLCLGHLSTLSVISSSVIDTSMITLLISEMVLGVDTSGISVASGIVFDLVLEGASDSLIDS